MICGATLWLKREKRQIKHVFDMEVGITVKSPDDKLTEEVVIGGLITFGGAYHQLKHVISDGCFVHPVTSALWNIIKGIGERGEKIDLISVGRIVAQKKMDVSEMTKMAINANDPTLHQDAYALVEMKRRRDMISFAIELAKNAEDMQTDISDFISSVPERISAVVKSERTDVKTLPDLLKEVLDVVSMNAKDSGPRGTPTGLTELDIKTGGLHAGDLVVIAAESSQGKTSLATSFAINIARAGGKIAMYSMEMSGAQIVARMMSSESGIPSSRIMYGKLSPEEIDTLSGRTYGMNAYSVYFDDSSTMSIDGIIQSVRQLKLKYGISGAIVDYLQILNVGYKGNREGAMADAARRLKNLAKELGIWVIALSQLSRDRERPEPSMSRLRDSGQIAEAADMVILIYRPEVYGKLYSGDFAHYPTAGTALIDLCKGRNTGTLKFICSFDASRTTFKDYAYIGKPLEDPLNNIQPYNIDNELPI